MAIKQIIYANQLKETQGRLLVSLGDGAANDAFGRLRVSEVFTLFDSKLTSNPSSNLIYDEELSGGTGVWISGDSCYRLSVSGGTGSYAIRQTRMSFNYQPGKSVQYLLTGLLPPQSGTTKRIGAFASNYVAPYEPHNGLFFELSGTTMAVCIAKNGVIERVTQDNWNIDKMDGTGVSGFRLDTSKVNIYLFDYEWLGVGRVRFGFNIDGLTVYCHEFLNANREKDSVYMRSPNLPIRYELRSFGGNGYMDEICATVGSETGFQPTGVIKAFDNGIVPKAVNSAGIHPVIAIRLKQSARDVTIQPIDVSILSDGSVNYRWALYIVCGTVPFGAGTWETATFNQPDQSCSVEIKNDFAAANTFTPTGSTVMVASGYVGSTNQVRGAVESQTPNSIHIGSKIDGTRDVLVLCVQRLATTNANYYASITLRELDGC